MGVDTRNPPLPAPTDISSVENGNNTADDLATDISRVTDKTSYSIPEDGSPVTIATKRHKDGRLTKHTNHSQTSLLIEYFEAAKSGDKVHSRPSVRVRVTPSSHKRSKTTSDQLRVTELGKDRKPSYTRRISLGNKAAEEKAGEATELSFSGESTVSGRPPVEVEFLQNASDLSQSDISTNQRLPTDSAISSMPPDSTLDGPLVPVISRRRSQSLERELEKEEVIIKDTLKAPERKRSRSLSRERITQKVMEKLTAKPAESASMTKDIKASSGRKSSRDDITEAVTSPRRTSRSRKGDDFGPSAESSLVSSNANRRSGESVSMRSGVSAASSINNPKLLQTVEDAIRRLILPELNALKEEQKTQKNRDKFEKAPTRDSSGSYSSREELKRRVSKHASAPDMSKARPKVVLNRDGDDPGVVLSGDSIKGRKHRRSSRDSNDSRSESRSHSRKSSGSRHRSKGEIAAAGLVGAGLTAAALKHHDSKESVDRKHRRKHRSKSRSRSASISENVEHYEREEHIPPMPMQGVLHGSEVTRDSILSSGTERRQSVSSQGDHTPVREVSRGSAGVLTSPDPRTPTRTPAALSRGLHSQHSNRSLTSLPRSAKSDRSVSGSNTADATAAGLARAAALSRSAETQDLHHDYTQYTPTRELSPVQSDASYREEHIQGGRHEYIDSPRSPLSVSSAGRAYAKKQSNLSMNSADSTPSYNLSRAKDRPKAVNLETPSMILGESGEYGTPGKEAEEFFQGGHEENERYRRELEETSASPRSYKRTTGYTDDSTDSPLMDRMTAGQDIRGVGANPEYVRTPVAVESAVASLHEPSNVSGQSSELSPQKRSHFSAYSTFDDQLAKESPIQATKEVDPADRMSPTKERWSTLKEQAAKSLSSSKSNSQHNSNNSPQQSVDQSIHEELIDFSANAVPLAHDPLPEIGHGLDSDEQSEVTTNPSIIQGPLGGDHYGGDRAHWPLDATPMKGTASQDQEKVSYDGHGKTLLAGAGAATAAGIAAAAAARFQRDQDLQSPVQRSYDEASLEDEYNARVEDDYDDEPVVYQKKTFSPQSPRLDEGYISAAHAGAITPDSQLREYYADNKMGGQYTPDIAADDPFGPATTGKHGRHVSMNSHGMESPLYDSATGRGMDRIQSKDVVALMDHLTVRDAQRNARDTEILVTLVRSAAEMRNQFEDMKRFIAEQDAALMQNTNQKAVVIEQKLQGPRPQPLGSPRIPRQASTDDGSEDLPTKRRNVFRRALKGLSTKSTNDMANIENMLVQLLGEVEGLKEMQTVSQPQLAQVRSQSHSLTSYENLRASGDAGYEPDGQAGTSSTPNHSGFLSNPSSSRQFGGAMHSGYDGRRGSEHRISTVLEGDEDVLSEHEARALDIGFENTERLLTPTQEVRRAPVPTEDTPTQPAGQFPGHSQDNTPKRKHKSSTSSIFGIPKISRWSKTTASTAAERNSMDRKSQPYSDHSRSGSQADLKYYNDEYQMSPDDRLRSKSTLGGGSQARSLGGSQGRSPSPLIPEEDYDDPKYKAHRNSLNLEHPQPRPGPTHRRTGHLENQAVSFGNMPLSPGSDRGHEDEFDNKFDQWGSNPSLVLGRNNRLSGGSERYTHGRSLSPIDSEGGYSGHSASEQAQPSKQQQSAAPPKVSVEQSAPDHSYGSNYGGYSSSPYSQGHLAPLEPIQEVRYSLETDRQVLTPSPSLHKSQGMSSPSRKITGPRPMGSRNASGQGAASGSGNTPAANIGTVRRKPVSAREADAESIPSYRDSFESETF